MSNFPIIAAKISTFCLFPLLKSSIFLAISIFKRFATSLIKFQSISLKVNLESGYNANIIENLRLSGHEVSKEYYFGFGGGQIIYELDDGYLAASDRRKDGQAVGF